MWEWAIGLGAVVVTVFISSITATWIVARKMGDRASKHALTTGLSALQIELSTGLEKLRSSLSNKIDQSEVDCGKAIESIRGKVGEIDVKLATAAVKTDTMWDFMMDRARLEARERGFVVKNSPLVLTEQGLAAIAPILPAVRAYCEEHPDIAMMSIYELEIELAKTFRHRLLEEVCEPNHIYMGACLVMLIEALRLEQIIPQVIPALA